MVPHVTCLSLLKPPEKWFKYCLTRHASTSVPVHKMFEPLVFKKSWSMSGSKACWLNVLVERQVVQTHLWRHSNRALAHTHTCQCVHTNTAECAKAGSNMYYKYTRTTCVYMYYVYMLVATCTLCVHMRIHVLYVYVIYIYVSHLICTCIFICIYTYETILVCL